MKILFYSTSSSVYHGEAIKTISLPSFTEQWEKLCEKHSEHEFFVATQLPGMFLCDTNGNEIIKAKKIRQILLKNDNEKEIASEIAEFKPDLAIALSFYVSPYDWLTIKDSVVAEHLRSLGIKTLAHPTEAALICFDKWQTHNFLERIGVPCAKAVYLHHELFINAGNYRDTKSNVYKTAVFQEVKKLRFPVIIKDTTGLSSFGADVVKNYEEALGILKSKKTSSDRIIEEMISGEQFGCEIYGIFDEKTGKGQYEIFPPFKFSTNQYGITSPKQSIKIGPLPEYSALRKTLTRLAEKLRLNGVAQVDLVFDKKKWFVIEINPRLSGMSTTYAASAKLPLSELIFGALCHSEAKLKNDTINTTAFLPTINIKFPILSSQRLSKLKNISYVAFVNQIENHAARQIREQGYCEVILTGKSFKELKENLLDLREKFCDVAENTFFEKAMEMCDLLIRQRAI
ncbi:MAG: ATP-grasp domain-containing protein [Treponema sp.]|nr:ATP-grasp domain-containing protein [Treponema sp.]